MARILFNFLIKANRIIAILIGVMLLACVVFVILDIILRQFGASFGGTDEVSGYVMALTTSWGMAYCLLELGHVRIDLIRRRGGAKIRALFDLIALASMNFIISMIVFYGWSVVATSIKNESRANTVLETKLALVQFPWLMGWVWFAFVGWLMLFIAFWMITKQDYKQSEAMIGLISETPDGVIK